MYIICRVDRMPYMLIDFSDAIQARNCPSKPYLTLHCHRHNHHR